MSRARTGAATVAAGALLLVACGGGDEAATTTRPAATTEPENDTAVDAASSTTPSTTRAPSAPSTPPPGSAAPPTSGATTTSPPATSGSGDTTVATDRWVDPTGTFRVAFPTEPQPQQTQAPTPDGGSIPVTAYLGEVAGAALIAACVDSPADLTDVDANLDSARDGALGQFGAILVDDERVELQGRPGVSFLGTIGTSGAVSGRAYLDTSRVCSLLVIAEPDGVAAVADPFLDSFEFVKEAA